jgi:hypothetical protein
MQALLASINLDPSRHDVWQTIYKDGVYTANLYYKHCYVHATTKQDIFMDLEMQGSLEN